jgi:ABC-type nitrate/sulfonate/bicarbonate transport system substrate-binding protein
MGGGAKTTALVAAGRAELSFVATEEGFLNAARGVDAGVVYVYNQNRSPIFRWAFLSEKAVTDLRLLKCKRVGVGDLASSSVYYGKGELCSLGLDPGGNADWIAVGIGQQAYAALLARSGFPRVQVELREKLVRTYGVFAREEWEVIAAFDEGKVQAFARAFNFEEAARARR